MGNAANDEYKELRREYKEYEYKELHREYKGLHVEHL